MVAPLFRRKGFPAHRFPAQLGDAVAPFVPVDFPPPVAARQRGTIDVAVSLLLTTLAVVTAVQNVVVREPFYSVAGRAKSAPEWQVPPNLLTNTLVPVVAGTPFKPVDLPLNRRVVNVPQFDPVRNISVLQLQAAPFKPVDLPIERAVSVTPPFEPPNVLINIPVTATSPFVEPYVTPITAVPRQVLSFDPPNVTINLPATVAVPFKPYDWTGPGRAESAVDWNVGQSLALTNARPFVPVDFGLTRARQQVSQLEQPNPALVLALQAAPFVPTDWGLTKAKQQVGPFEPPNLLLSTLGIQPNPPAPVVIFDWKLTQNAWQPFLDTTPNLLTSTFNPTSPPIPPPDAGQGGGKTKKQKYELPKKHKYELKPTVLREAFEIRREEEFLATFQERLDELAGIVDAPAKTRQERIVQKAAEIKLLSNVNALAKSYSVELPSVTAAQELITQRMADLEDEEALAIILIAASL